MRHIDFKLNDTNKDSKGKNSSDLHQDISALYMDKQNDYNMLYVQHNHIVDIDNHDRQIPFNELEIVDFIRDGNDGFTRGNPNRRNRMSVI